jgi:hypothetical protein
MASNPKYRIEVDAQALSESFGEFAKEVEQAVEDSVKLASSMTYAKANEMAADKLKSRRQTYQDALSYEEVTPGIWVVSLDPSALWIEEGMDPHSMVDDLLRINPKVGKNGLRYKVIPFDHGRAPSQQTAKAKEISDQVKRELKSLKVPFKKIEMNPDGTPKLGTVFRKNIPSARPTAKAKYPSLHGLTITQRKVGDKVRRDVMTFRIVSDKHKAEGLWFHPGLQAVKIIDQVFEWISKEFDDKILPQVLERFR